MIVLPGRPIPLARPRFSAGKVYDSQAAIKNDYRLILMSQCKHKPYSSSLLMELEFIFEVPKSLSQKKRLELLGKAHIIKPDLDNLIKFVLDIGTGILYTDDKVISEIKAKKVYGSKEHSLLRITQLP